MNNFRFLAILILSFAFIFDSCKKKEETTASITPSYKNQNLKGVINDLPWEYALGHVTTTEDFSDSTKFAHSFSIMDSTQDDTCLAYADKRSQMLFFLTDANAILTKGSHILKLDVVNWEDSKTVTFVFYEAGSSSPENYVATKGSYEILSVDTTTKIVTGRMSVKYDSHHSVNGNFSLKYCYW